ncbi:MAG: S-layer homology domain-containing protein [Bacillota bacterium]
MRIFINKSISIILFILIFAAVFITGIEAMNASNNQTEDKLWQLQNLLHSDDTEYSFSDISGHWAEDGMNNLSYMDVLKGFPDGTLKPSKTITRGEYVTMLVRALEIPITDTYKTYYDDVTVTSWCYYSVSSAKQYGLLEVFQGKSFEPDKIITREEMAVIAVEAVNTDYKQKAISFSDIKTDYRYYDEIVKAGSLGIIKGMPDGTFKPKGSSTRAEASVIIQRLMRIRDAALESEDAVLKNFVQVYVNNIYDYSNNGNSEMLLVFQASAGKEKKLNLLRSKAIADIKLEARDITRTVTEMISKVIEKSVYLSNVKVSYKVKVESGFLTREYRVYKTIKLKKKGDSWTVYDSKSSFILLSEIDSKPDNANNNRINLAWDYMSGKTPQMDDAISIDGLNVISPTWFTLEDINGNVGSIADLEYTKWAHKKGYKVWALFDNKFNKEMTSRVINNPEARKTAIDAVIRYSQQYDVDGINIDFENMYTEDRDAFTLFVKEFYEQAKAKELVVSVDVTVITPKSNWSNCYDRKELAKVSDYIALMAYDQHWSGSPVSGSVAQLTWVETELQEVLLEVPAEKLLLGLPFYTRLWKEEYQASTSKTIVTSKAISMETAEKTIADNNAVKVWDDVSGQYYATYQKDGATYKIWLEDAKSIELKAKLVPKYKLAGTAAWRLGFEKPEIWTVIKKSINFQ